MNVLVTVLQIILCVGMISTILLQSGKSAGLSGSISGASEAFFGKKKGMDEFLVKVTTVLAVAFFAICIASAVIK
jgi:preprotein translocase subunit SecG